MSIADTTQTITIDPESELGKALPRIDKTPIVLEHNGDLFRVVRVGAETDSEEARTPRHDPVAFRAAVRDMAGFWTPEEGERLKEMIYQAREDGTRPPDRP